MICESNFRHKDQNDYVRRSLKEINTQYIQITTLFLNVVTFINYHPAYEADETSDADLKCTHIIRLHLS